MPTYLFVIVLFFTPQTETITPETTESQLVESVKKQVEYYFSKENLLIDPFLTSQMDAQMCVPIHVVMKVSNSHTVLCCAFSAACFDSFPLCLRALVLVRAAESMLFSSLDTQFRVHIAVFTHSSPS